MDTLEHLKHLLAYNIWANRKMIDAFAAQALDENVLTEARRFMSHLLLAEREWFARLDGKDSTGFDFWQSLSIDDCRKLHARNEEDYTRLLASVSSDDDLNRNVSYKNSKGVSYQNTIREILTHVFHHSTYHRGQVATAMRANGSTPAYTDYIAFIRERA